MRTKLNNNIISGTLFILLLAGLSSCGKNTKNAGALASNEVIPDSIVEMRNDQIKLAGIETGTVEMRMINNSLKVNGAVSVGPQNLASVCAPMGGFVKSVSLLPGNQVNKGQTLAIIENREFVDIQQEYLEAQSKLEYAEAEFNRHSDLFKEDVYSEKNLQQVTADYKSLKARVNALARKLALIGIDPAVLTEENITASVPLLSPISGFIRSVNVNVGKSVSPVDVVFEIINNDKLILELTLFEKDAGKVALGQNVGFFINNETERHDAVIYQTGKSVRTDRTIIVYAAVTGKCKNVLPGMYVNAVIETSSNRVASLPSEAIVTFDDKDYIFVFEKDKEENGIPFSEYKIVEVRKGASDEGFTEVGLPPDFNPGESKVVTKGAYNLLSAKKNAGEMAC
ncbi:MAG: efflux RND transporter periplasmic adaptor subunit [Bacteroidales bacterium]